MQTLSKFRGGALQETIMKVINRYITSQEELQALLKGGLTARQDIVEEKTEDEFSKKIKDLENELEQFYKEKISDLNQEAVGIQHNLNR